MPRDTTDRPQMDVEDFYELVSRAPREIRNRLEFLGGRLCMSRKTAATNRSPDTPGAPPSGSPPP